MKHFYLISLCLIGLLGQAQSIEKIIIVRDATTNKPIEDALIVVLKTQQNIFTNADGKGRFMLKNATGIQISHASYNKVLIKSATLVDKETVVLLKNNLNDLEELIITSQPQRILRSLVENSKRQLTIPARLKVYAREFFKLNRAYAYYNDGLINFQIFGNKRKFDSNILVEQNRAFGLLETEVSQDLLGYNLNDIMENYYNFKYLNPVLDSRAKKQYDFVLKVFSKNKRYNLFTITPLDNNVGLLDAYNIVYEPQRNLIISVSTVLPDQIIAKHTKSTSVGSRNMIKSNYKSIYHFDNENYYLLSSKEEIAFEKIGRKETKIFEVRNYFFTMNFSTQNYTFTESDVFKDKTLFNKKNVILTDYWNVSGVTATEEKELIIKDLENKL